MTRGHRGQVVRAGWVLLGFSLWVSGCGKSDGSPPGAGTASSADTTAGERIREHAQEQMAALLTEKSARVPALQKVDSQLVYALRMSRGEAVAPGVEKLAVNVAIDGDGFVNVEITVQEVGPVVALVPALGGKVLGSYPKFNGVTARVPLASLEQLGAEPSVKFVRELRDPMLHREEPPGAARPGKPTPPGDEPPLKKPAGKGPDRGPSGALTPSTSDAGAVTNVVNSSAGVTVHRAGVAQTGFGANGQGVQVGVLSDSVRYLSSVQALGDLPAVTVLTGQEGPTGTGEGTAMLEIVHDMAPSADLYFATAFTGVAAFATNILSLRAAGCDVIVDDVFYYDESPFQDGPIAQAVNTVVNDGAVYLSSAGNAGSVAKNTAGVYEGNFVDSGASIPVLDGLGQINQFAGTSTYNEVTAIGSTTAPYTLFWSDPLGESSNDYDLFVLDSTLSTVVASSTNVQSGLQDPYEQAVTTPALGHRLVIVKKTGAADRFLHLNGNRNRLAHATTGQTKGHSATTGALSVAAAPAGPAITTGAPTGPYPGVFTGSSLLENFSSDGLRRVFYNADGTLANSGNSSLLADGGVVRQKPDITAADGVETMTPGFSIFYGTSAAAPHAAGIVAQMLSVAPGATNAQIRTALTSTAIDVEGAGTDNVSGAGIVMSDSAVSALTATPALSLGTVTTTPADGADTALDPGESATLSIALENTSGFGATGVSAILSSSSPDVTITQAASAYPDISSGGSATNSTAFGIRVSSDAFCGAALDFTLTVTAGGAEQTFDFDVLTGAPGSPDITFAYSGAPVAIPDGVGVESPGTPATATFTVPEQTEAISSLVFRLNGTASSTAVGATTVGLDHSYVGDLSLSLTSPSGTTVPLIARMNDFSGSQDGNNFYNTVLDDDASSSISDATVAPFTGTFRPVGSLASFAGEDPTGVWTLTAQDFYQFDTGSIRAFSIVVTPRHCTVFDNQGATCTDDSECSTGQCVDGVCCDQPCGGNNPNDCQACDATGTCGAAPASTVCRAAASECDEAETCDGATTCPADASKPAGTTCGGAPSGACDVQDTCSGGTGATATCLANVAAAGTSCRASAGDCDVAETCTGLSAECPADVLVTAGTQCRAAAGVCDVAEACTGSSAACPSDALAGAGTTCRASTGDCDAAEACTGSSATCPADAARPVGTPCGGAPSGACDAQDTCSGTVGATAVCVPVFQPSSTVCRSSAGDCDVAESCTGNSAACPADGFVQAGTQCRASAGDCDVAEACTGSSAACPANGFVATGTTCRASAGDCDVAEACSGNAASCPADTAQPAGTACGGPPNGVCDAQDTCTGSVGATATCTANFQPPSTVCRDAAGVCDTAESCTGSTTTCPADAFVSAGTTCRAPVGDCDVAEACTGSTAACPADAAQPAGSACGGPPNGDCDAQDTCAGTVGATATCTANFLPPSTVCRDAAGVCDVAESCTGSTPACPANVFVSAGTTCRASIGDCDTAEACSGSDAACPADAAQPAGTACGAAPSGDCDAQDTCSGSTGATATCVERFQPSSTTCRPAAGDCDVAESCTGSATTCPADVFVSAGTVCRPSAGECDVAEACSGDTASCGADAAAAPGTACGGEPNGPCDAQDTCSGTVGASASCVAAFGPDGTECSDDNACTTNDACSAGACRSGAALDCDDDNECTADVCDTDDGCAHEPRDGELCADGEGVCAGSVCRIEPMGTGGTAGGAGTSGTSGSSGSGGAAASGGSSAGGGAGEGGGSGEANEAGAAGEAGEGTVKPPRPPVTTRSGCKCEVGTEGDGANHAWAVVLAAAAAVLRRRGRASIRAC